MPILTGDATNPGGYVQPSPRPTDWRKPALWSDEKWIELLDYLADVFENDDGTHNMAACLFEFCRSGDDWTTQVVWRKFSAALSAPELLEWQAHSVTDPYYVQAIAGYLDSSAALHLDLVRAATGWTVPTVSVIP